MRTSWPAAAMLRLQVATRPRAGLLKTPSHQRGLPDSPESGEVIASTKP
jgi:hypothetical protein